MYLFDTSPAPEKPGKYLKTPSDAGEVFIHTFPAPKKCFYTLIWHRRGRRSRRSIYTHFSGAEEVLLYTYLAPERPEKPEKYLYTPVLTTNYILLIFFTEFFFLMLL